MRQNIHSDLFQLIPYRLSIRQQQAIAVDFNQSVNIGIKISDNLHIGYAIKQRQRTAAESSVALIDDRLHKNSRSRRAPSWYGHGGAHIIISPVERHP